MYQFVLIVLVIRYAQLEDSEFYRVVVDAEGNRAALIFATNAQLEMLSSATQLYFDATFKVVPTIYYQLFTLFVPFADFAFPVCYASVSYTHLTLPTKRIV